LRNPFHFRLVPVERKGENARALPDTPDRVDGTELAGQSPGLKVRRGIYEKFVELGQRNDGNPLLGGSMPEDERIAEVVPLVCIWRRGNGDDRVASIIRGPCLSVVKAVGDGLGLLSTGNALFTREILRHWVLDVVTC
jgi:hypothetical protein